MIPGWKLKRELGRMFWQIVGIPRLVLSLPGRLREVPRRVQHDADFPRNLRIEEGVLPAGPRIAVFVLFQPAGIAPSVGMTCDWLIAAGFVPLIVSNAPLSATDRAALAGRCWRVVERPNFGYDFGAYRDGLRLIREDAPGAERVILMNDSVWCPVDDDGWLARMEALGADLSGLLQDEKVAHDRKGGTPTDQRHIESYFLMIGPGLLHAPAFRAFWDSYQQTDFKPHTIKRGELGFSRLMQAAGFTVQALTRRSIFLERLQTATAEELHETLSYASYDDAALQRENAALLAAFAPDDGWKTRAFDHIRRCANRRRFNSCFPLANGRVFGTMFLKKSGEKIFVDMRNAYLRAVADGLLPPPPAPLLAEIAARQGARGPVTGAAPGAGR